MSDDIASPAGDLSLRFKSFLITNEESKELTILGEDIKLSEAECRLSLIGKVVTTKAFVFGKEDEIFRVLAGKPWFFNNSFLILSRWSPEMKLQQLVFQHSPIWVQIWGLPLQFYSHEVGTKIGNSMGEFLDISMPGSGCREGRLMKILVNINITTPIRRGMKLKLDDGDPFWVEFQYEKLPTFCCYCGYLGHEQRSCMQQAKDMENGKPGGNRWRPSSPAKSVNGRSPSRGANLGEDTNQHSNSERDLEVRDLEITGFQVQIGDTGEKDAFQAGNSKQSLPSKTNSAANGNLKPRALGPSLEQEGANRPKFCLDPITLTLKKRGRPVGSKSKSDKRRGQIHQKIGSKLVNEVSSSSGATVGVGSKRPSSVGDNQSSACDVDEVCSPAKKPRLGRGNSEASQDSVMDEALATDTMEDASQNWPQGLDSHSSWHLLNVYLSPEEHVHYQQLLYLSDYIRDLNAEVVVWGDFNDILYPEEKRGGLQRSRGSCGRFQTLLNNCGLLDLGFRGYPFTWRNNRSGTDFIESRLDRALVSSSWSDMLPRFVSTPGGLNMTMLSKLCRLSWEDDIVGSRLFCISQKIKKCRLALKSWRSSQNLNSRKEIDGIKEDIGRLEAHEREFHLKEIAGLEDNLTKAWEKEELYWKQKSHQKWLQFGDRNTSFFHASTVARHRRNHISGIENSAGVWISEQKTVLAEFQSFFAGLFTCEDNQQDNRVVHLIPRRVTASVNSSLIRAFSTGEIKAALFDMHPNKAPGYDGMTPGFFQKYWDIVGLDVCWAVRSFFHGGKMLGSLNRTNIVLIPKIPTPTKVSQFRPISLCTTIYKVIAKVLANRLCQFLPSIISENQSAFVEGRQITDNVLIAHELTHYIRHKRSGTKGVAAFKLDMTKAYDRVDWRYLEQVMRQLGFHALWIGKVMECVKMVSFSITVNGEAGESFHPSRAASGQKVNKDKSSVFFSPNISSEARLTLANRVGISMEAKEAKYLGLPVFLGNSKHELFSYVKDRTIKRLRSWIDSRPNSAGREVLIKSVLLTIPSYAMSCFWLPKQLMNQISAEIAKFWWGSKEGERKIHWIKWDKLSRCKGKGGLGFRDLEVFNRVLIAKQGWKLISGEPSLFKRIFKGKYFPNTTFFNANVSCQASWAWRSICWARELLNKGWRWQVCSGKDIRIWEDPWLPKPPTFKVSPSSVRSSTITYVSDLTDNSTKTWKMQLIKESFNEEEATVILSLPISTTQRRDRKVWHYSPNGVFTVKSAYCLEKESLINELDMLIAWKKRA
ncbi:uncharacterized protein LOC131306858 [Rhododendron vialii]|uniref:uncharacterized protein LOC131306858 n=1 Tax=Rhododendron vialii TaxID=182163 RepID=UPI00265D89E7|nr:uncharacterized protein LOC131306858 [Rhododendron vialii]